MLPTGAGKTLIAALLVNHYASAVVASRREEASLSAARPRFVICVCPTKLLVAQQAGVLAAATPLRVVPLTGDDGVDAWDAAAWRGALREAELLVATPALIRDALARGYLQARAGARAACAASAHERGECTRGALTSICVARALLLRRVASEQLRDVVLLVLDECHHAKKRRVARCSLLLGCARRRKCAHCPAHFIR